MKIAKEYKRGFTLTEVIVSIAIVSIVILAVSSTFLSIRRIEKQKIARENIVSEIRNIYNIFSSEPDDFHDLIQGIYPKNTFIEEENETIFFITYNSLFQPSETDYYTYTMKCKYSIEEDEQEEHLTLEYTLVIELPDKFQSYIKEEALTRTIKVWGQS
ncbi:MAG: type II secretion system protein [Bacilli bacterium]